MGQAPDRVDGLPSLNRVYRWVGPGAYRLVRDSGIAPSAGAREFDTGDFDRDGRVDLLMVSFDPKVKGPLSSVHAVPQHPTRAQERRGLARHQEHR